MTKMRISLVALLLVLIFPIAAFAQEATEEAPAPFPALAGDYEVEQTVGGQTQTGATLTVTGTGPIYQLSVTAPGETTGTDPVVGLGQGPVVVSVSGTAGSDSTCEPATLLRQRDGTLFGQWIDGSMGDYALGAEFYVPRGDTTDFVGTYDLIGSYATGEQYLGNVEITKDANGVYSLAYYYTSDELSPDTAESTENGVGTVSGNVLGYGFSEASAADCSVTVIRFAADGSLTADFVLPGGSVGTGSGTRKG